MTRPVSTMELAQRLRQDAETASFPAYADLMRRAAEELEALARIPTSERDQREMCGC